MKKVLLFTLCSSFITAATYLQAEPAAVFPAKKPGPIVRDTKDPLRLPLLGRNYTLFQSQEDEDDSDAWNNIYLPQGTTSLEEEGIVIQKITDTTCDDVMEDVDEEETMTLDTRNRNDQLVSGEADEQHYVVVRFIQDGRNAFTFMGLFLHNAQTDAQWLQLQRNILSSIRSTPQKIITDNFVEATCKFGQDCRL